MAQDTVPLRQRGDAATPRAIPLPRGVLFDMDGILVDSEPAHAAAYAAAFREAGLALELEEYRRFVTLDGGSTRDLYRAKGGSPEAWEDVFARKCERFSRIVAEDLALLPGVAELLSGLARRETPCVLATSSSAFNAGVVLGRFGLSGHFRAVLTLEDVRRGKPDPEVFLKAAAALGLRPEECVAFEDAPKGVRAAMAAGVPCVAVPTDWTRDCDFGGAALVVESLAQVSLPLLERICCLRKD